MLWLEKMKCKKKWPIILLAAVLLSMGAFYLYVSDYYRADQTAVLALNSSDLVTVKETAYGWLMDGPSEDTALVFYPGGKVEETAYTPLLKQLAGKGLDVCLMKMPFHLAFFDIDGAERVIHSHPYTHWYIGGHSLGGAMAAVFAAHHGNELDGVILLAAYPTEMLDQRLTEILLYGTEDRVLNRSKIEKGRAYAPANYVEYIISGGNHAQFGNYGAQIGDGKADISTDEQQRETVDVIIRALTEKLQEPPES